MTRNPVERLPGPTGEVIDRILQDIASEEQDSGGPDDGNPYHTFTTRISDVKALIAAVYNPNDRLREALEECVAAREAWLAADNEEAELIASSRNDAAHEQAKSALSHKD